jgi:hypothetical protein
MFARFLGATFAVTAVFSACRGNDYDTRYFHHVDGNAHVAGDVSMDVRLYSGSIPYGAATISPASGALNLDWSIENGDLYATIAEPVVGVQDVTSIRLSLPAGHSFQTFECILSCGACTADLIEVTDDVITGTLTCSGMRSCGEPIPLPEPQGDPACGGRNSSIIDVTADFTLDQASDRHLDY